MDVYDPRLDPRLMNRPNWSCDCCGRAPLWHPKHPDNPEWKMPFVYDRGPHQATFGGKTYQACSVECVRQVYLVRGLEMAFSKVAETLKLIEEKAVSEPSE